MSVTHYGVQTPSRHTILVVTTDRREAEQALRWIENGRIVHRTITYGGWLPDSADDGTTALVVPMRAASAY